MSSAIDGTFAQDDSGRIASFRLTAEEASLANADIRTRSGSKDWVRRTSWVMAVVVIVYGFVDPLLWHTGVILWKIEPLGFGYALMAAALTWGLGSVKAGVETVLRFNENGMFCERPVVRSIPWKAVRGAFDDGSLIGITLRETLRHPVPRHYVIPKRVLPDEGAALWELLGDSMIGKRMLVASPFATTQRRPAIRAITNTRS